MSEENNQNNISIEIESHQNSSGENRRGAPVRTQPIIKQNFWFYDKEAIQVISILAKFGQLQFKILSGKTASELKDLYSKKYNNNYEKIVKGKRKKFLNKMRKFQQQLSKQLALEGNFNYYFLNPSSKYEIQFQNNQIITLPIHEKFIGILNSLIHSINHDNGVVRSNRISKIIQEITSSEQHSYIQKWALIKSWQQKALGKLSIFQQYSEKYDYHKLEKDLNKVTKYYEDLQKKSYVQLKQQFSKTIKKNIKKLIITLQEVFEKQ